MKKVLSILGFAYIVAYQYGYVRGSRDTADHFNRTYENAQRLDRMKRAAY